MMYVPKGKRFRFKNLCIREADCFNLIKDSWSGNETKNIVEKVQNCCFKLEEWGGGKVRELKRKIKNCRCDLRRFRSRRDEYGIQKYNETRWEFLKLLEQKEIFWQQRANQFWLREGDQNTRFFHNFASGKKKNNQLSGLRDKIGEWKEDVADMQDIIVEYFSNLFMSSTVT